MATPFMDAGDLYDKKTMDLPQCKSCGTEYLWDWELDTYRTRDGKCAVDQEIPSQPLDKAMAKFNLRLNEKDAEWFKPSEGSPKDVEITLYCCVKCHTVIGALLHDFNQGAVVAVRTDWPTWANVDWETFAYENQG